MLSKNSTKLTKRTNRKSILADHERVVRIEQDLLTWIGRHPNHGASCAAVADRYGVAPSQINTILKKLEAEGKIERPSIKTYRLREQPAVAVEQQQITQPEETAAQDTSSTIDAERLVELAKDFIFATGSSDLRAFIKWVTEEK